jgi:hypothetical protein
MQPKPAVASLPQAPLGLGVGSKVEQPCLSQVPDAWLSQLGWVNDDRINDEESEMQGWAPSLQHSSAVLLRLNNIFGWVIRRMQQAAVCSGYGEVARPHRSTKVTERLSCAVLVTAGLQSQAE